MLHGYTQAAIFYWAFGFRLHGAFDLQSANEIVVDENTINNKTRPMEIHKS